MWAKSSYLRKKPCLKLHAQASESFFRNVVKNAATIGMTVNESKTQLLCLSTAIDSEVSSFIRTTTGGKIESGEHLKILGFHFNTNPSVECHVQEIEKKIRKRAWVIRNLKKAGLGKRDLLTCYFTLVRPVLDYAVPVYHSMLNKCQVDRLEKLQRDIFKTIYGFDRSYNEILENETLESLTERRQKLFDSFALKMLYNQSVSSSWFPVKLFEHANLRKERIFVEKHARTLRLYNSPLYAMRRRLNEITPVTFE